MSQDGDSKNIKESEASTHNKEGDPKTKTQDLEIDIKIHILRIQIEYLQNQKERLYTDLRDGYKGYLPAIVQKVNITANEKSKVIYGMFYNILDKLVVYNGEIKEGHDYQICVHGGFVRDYVYIMLNEGKPMLINDIDFVVADGKQEKDLMNMWLSIPQIMTVESIPNQYTLFPVSRYRVYLQSNFITNTISFTYDVIYHEDYKKIHSLCDSDINSLVMTFKNKLEVKTFNQYYNPESADISIRQDLEKGRIYELIKKRTMPMNESTIDIYSDACRQYILDRFSEDMKNIGCYYADYLRLVEQRKTSFRRKGWIIADDGYNVERKINSMLLQEESSDNLCTICQQPLFGQYHIKNLSGCSHSFHKNCISKWLDIKKNCPMCRNIVRVDDD